MRVGILDRTVRTRYIACIGKAAAVLSFVLIFIDLENVCYRVTAALLVTLAFVAIYFFIWMRIRLARSYQVQINGFFVDVVVGDLFDQCGLKVIPFNDRYDTKVDNRIIGEHSLNGIYIRKYLDVSPEELREEIQNDADMELHDDPACKCEPRVYSLGSVHVRGDYALVAFSHFDESNRAVLTMEEYVCCLLSFWKELDRVYAMRDIAVPLLGGGITRIQSDINPDKQFLLETLLRTLELSQFRPCDDAHIRIVIREKDWASLRPIACYETHFR